jgi:hypothetical protein
MDPQLQQSGIFVLAIFLAVLAERGWQWLRRRRARRWPVAQGRVLAAQWRQPRTGTNRYFIGDLSYCYFVSGQFYSGYHRRSFSSMTNACAWARRMEGAAVQVRYHPKAAARSVLLEEEQAGASSNRSAAVERSQLVASAD